MDRSRLETLRRYFVRFVLATADAVCTFVALTLWVSGSMALLMDRYHLSEPSVRYYVGGAMMVSLFWLVVVGPWSPASDLADWLRERRSREVSNG